MDSSVYVEPTIAEEIIYEDDTYFIKKLWQTTAPIYKHNGVYKALTAGNAFNSKGISTFFSLDGKRLISLDFDYMSECANGLVCVNIKNHGCKLIDTNMNIYPKGDVFYDYVTSARRKLKFFFTQVAY